MKNFFLFFLGIMIVVFSLGLISSVPEMPMIVTGKAYVNDEIAENGTEIVAKLNGEVIEKTHTNKKGEFRMLLQKLNKNQSVSFYVDGIDSDKNIFYKSGDFVQLSLKVKKPYFIYYIGGAVVLGLAFLLIWKRKTIPGLRKKQS